MAPHVVLNEQSKFLAGKTWPASPIVNRGVHLHDAVAVKVDDDDHDYDYDS